MSILSNTIGGPANVLTKQDVQDTLVSTSTEKPLSANQGSVLYNYILDLNKRGMDRGNWDASTNTPTLPSTPDNTFTVGDFFEVTVAGTQFGFDFTAGDRITVVQDINQDNIWNKNNYNQEAIEISYNNSTSGLSAINAQTAIDEIDSNLDTEITDRINADITLQDNIDLKVNDNEVVHLTGDEIIDNVKTFTSFPITPSSIPTTDYQVANKKYTDDVLSLKTDKTTTISTGNGLTGGGDLSNNRTLTVDFTTNWKGISETLVVNQKTLYDALNSTKDYSAIYVDAVNGSDSTGDGTKANPYATITKALNPTGSVPISSRTIYVKSSTTENITFEALNTSLIIVLDPKSQHSGNITLVDGNTSIYFISNSGTALLSGTVNDGSKGNIYFNCTVIGTYNKTGGSGSIAPIGYVEFGYNSNLDDLVLNISGNSTIRTLGTGAIGQLTQSNGIFACQHKGSIYSPIITGGANPLLGQPICLLQGQVQLIFDGSNKSLSCNASYGIVYIAGISTLQNDFASYGKIDFTGAGVNCFCFVWSDSQLASSGDIPPLTGFQLVNFADYLNANYTPTNYTPVNVSVKGHLSGINSKLGTLQTTITASNGLQKVGNDIQGINATTSVKGVTQLSNTYNGTSQILATTEKALSDGLALKADQTTTYTKTETNTLLNAKQATLVSGTNIKSINGSSILGSGDIAISGVESQRISVTYSTGAATYANFILGGVRFIISQVSGSTGNYITVKFRNTGNTAVMECHYVGAAAYYNSGWKSQNWIGANLQSGSPSINVGLFYSSSRAAGTWDYNLIVQHESGYPVGTAGKQFKITSTSNVNTNRSGFVTVALLGG